MSSDNNGTITPPQRRNVHGTNIDGSNDKCTDTSPSTGIDTGEYNNEHANTTGPSADTDAINYNNESAKLPTSQMKNTPTPALVPLRLAATIHQHHREEGYHTLSGCEQGML